MQEITEFVSKAKKWECRKKIDNEGFSMPEINDFPAHFEKLRSNLQNTNWAVLFGAGLRTMKKLTEDVLAKT